MKPYIRTGLAWSAVATILSVGLTVYTWTQLPEAAEIPVHWDIEGRPDRFAEKGTAMGLLMIVPGAIFLTGVILALIPPLDPRRGNIEIGRKAYLATWIGTAALMLAVHTGICVATLKSTGGADLPNGFVRYVVAGCGLLIIVIGNYMPKTRASFLFGVRTPWTLSSDLAWEKTHRVAGPVFMAAGALGIAGAFIFDGIWLALQMTAFVGSAALISVVYSYFAWKSASDRDDGTGLTV